MRTGGPEELFLKTRHFRLATFNIDFGGVASDLHVRLKGGASICGHLDWS
jgi:hypothetical protein